MAAILGVTESARTSGFWFWTARIKLIVELLAYFIGASWVLFTFVEEHQRTYQERGDLTAKLDWSSTPMGDCQGEYEVSFRNVAKIPVTVAYAELTVSEMDNFVSLPPGEARYVDSEQMRTTHSFYSEETTRLNGTFQPDEGDSEGFVFHFSKSISAPVLFVVKLWDKNKKAHDPEHPKWSDFQWGWPCYKGPTGAGANAAALNRAL
jgi:hypothetical protein